MSRHRYEQSFAKDSDPLDDRASMGLRELATRMATESLLRAQLRAGQHILPFAIATVVGARVGLEPHQIRPAAGDPTIPQQGAIR